MIFSIPIFVEERTGVGGLPLFIVRPLHRAKPEQRAEKLSRALARLTGELHQLLHDLSQEPQHEELALWTMPMPTEEAMIEVRIELASGSHLRRFFVGGYPAWDRKLGASATAPAGFSSASMELSPSRRWDRNRS